MLREGNPLLITIGVTEAASTPIDLKGYAGGSFELPTGSGTTEITPYANVGDAPYGIANDEDWQPEQSVAVSAEVPYPITRFAYHYRRIKLVASAGTATANVPVYLKS
jgi:hypothetical protein